MIRFLCCKLRPPSPTPGIKKDFPLEGVRGICALLVLVAHLFLPDQVLDPGWIPPQLFSWFNLGYPAVLMFFVLSGYVIGLATTRPASAAEVQRYLLHRAARLLPLNVIAVLVSWLLLVHVESRTILGNLCFLQNTDPYPGIGSFPLFANNPNLWSLNYEAVYYLAFIALWVWTPPAGAVFGGMVLLICVHVFGGPVPLVFARYACGGLYWLSGLAVAWSGAAPEPAPRRSNWPAAALSAYAIWNFSPLRSVCDHWGWYDWMWPAPTPLSPHRLDFLPACVSLLLSVTGRAPELHRVLGQVCLIIGLAGVVVHWLSGDWQGIHTVSLIALLTAMALSRFKFSFRPLQMFAPLGGISFAIYALAVPLQLAQRSLLPHFSGTALTFSLRLVFVLFLVTGTAWLIERRVCVPAGKWIKLLGNPAGRSQK